MQELNKTYPTVTSRYLYADEIDCGPDVIDLPADSILCIFARVGFYNAVNTPLRFACAGDADVSLFIGNLEEVSRPRSIIGNIWRNQYVTIQPCPPWANN